MSDQGIIDQVQLHSLTTGPLKRSGVSVVVVVVLEEEGGKNALSLLSFLQSLLWKRQKKVTKIY